MNHKGLLSFFSVCILLVLLVGSIGGTAVDRGSGSLEAVDIIDGLSGRMANSRTALYTPAYHRVIPDVVEAFNQLTQQGEWQGVYPDLAPYTEDICLCVEIPDLGIPAPVDICMPCSDPLDCCMTRTLHFQGVARHPRPGNKAVFYLSRAGQPGNSVFDSEGVLWVAEVSGPLSGEEYGERIASTRLLKGYETKFVYDLNDSVVRWIDFNEYLDNPGGTPPGRLDYDHPGGMQAAGNILAVALSGRNHDALHEGKIAFFDTSDPIDPKPLKIEIAFDDYKPGSVGMAFHPSLRQYFVFVNLSRHDNKSIWIYKSNRSDFKDPDFEFELFDKIHHQDLEALADNGDYQMEPDPQSMNIVVDEDNKFYLIGAANTDLYAPIINGVNRMWLWEIGFKGVERDRTILIPKARADKRLHSYGDDSGVDWPCSLIADNMVKQEANFSAGAGAYVSPTGELLYYATAYWNLGPGGTVRMAELRSKYVSHTKTCGYLLQDDHLGGSYTIAEGSTLEFDNDIPAVRPWVHMFENKNFEPGNQVMMDYDGQWSDDYDNFRELDGKGGFRNKMSSFRFCGHPGITLEIFDGVPGSPQDWEKAKTANDGWIQCDGTGEVIEVPNLSALGDHCRHLDSSDSDDFEDDADSARLLWGGLLPPKEWRVEGDAGYTLENATDKPLTKVFKGAPGFYTVYLKIADKEESATVRVFNVPPAIESLDVTPTPLDEGQPITVNAEWSDPGAPVVSAWVDWGDGTVSEMPGECFDCGGPYGGPVDSSHTYADNGEYEVEVCFDDDLEDNIAEVCESRLVTVNNVAPTFTAGSDVTIDEAGTFTLLPINFNDKGTADTHTATIDWGDILPKDPSNAQPAAVSETPSGPPGSTAGSDGIVAGGSFVYGDNSTYIVEVCVTDDDGGTTCDDLEVTVNNIYPTLFFDKGAAISFAGGPAFLARRGVEQIFQSEVADAGSDDLTCAWTFPPSSLGKTTTFFNNDSTPDPAHSPDGVFPFSKADTNKTTFTIPGVYAATIDVTDDDDGHVMDSLPLLITDSRGCTAVHAVWGHQFGVGGKQTIDDLRLQGYLDLIRFASAYFDDGNLADLRDAAAIYNAQGAEGDNLLQQHALAAWLNFASGGVLWNRQIRHLDGPFHEIIGEIDAVLLNPAATKKDLADARKDAIRINTSKPGSSTCNDAGAP